MSILLEALRQKSREAAQKSQATPSAKAASALQLVDQPTIDHVVESLDAVVHELQIEPPHDFDWQLSPPHAALQDGQQDQAQFDPVLEPDQDPSLPIDHELKLLFPITATDEPEQPFTEPVSEASVASLTLLDENRLPGSYDLSEPSGKNRSAEVLREQVQDPSWLSEERPLDLVHTIAPEMPVLSDVASTTNVDMLASDTQANKSTLTAVVGEETQLTAADRALSASDAKRYLGLSKQAQALSEKEPQVLADAGGQKIERDTVQNSLTAQRKVKLKPKWQVRKELLWVLPLAFLLPVAGYVGMNYYLAMQQSLTSQLASMQVDIPQAAAESAVVLPSSSDHPLDQEQSTAHAQVTTEMTVSERLPAPVLEEKLAVGVKQKSYRNDAQLSEKPQRMLKPVVKEAPLVSSGSVIGSDAIVISRAPSVDSLLQDAWLAWQQKDVAQAESLYRQVLERQPSQRDALIGMMAIYQYRGLPAQARDIATRLTQLFPYDQEVKSLVGQIEKNTTAFDSRETQLKLQSQAAPNDASIIYQLGIHYARLQRWSEAQHMFAQASQMDELQAEYFANLAISLDHLGKRESAIAAYQRAIELAQMHPSGVNVEALTHRLSALLE